MWADWVFIILGILLLAVFVWKRFQKARTLSFDDIILVSFGVGAFFAGLLGLLGITP